MELSREEVQRRLGEVGYVADPQLAMAITLMRTLGRPLLLEGEAGVGKTEVGKALARMLERPLIRLQCYEGLDANAAVYEWNYQRQLLAIKIRRAKICPPRPRRRTSSSATSCSSVRCCGRFRSRSPRSC